MNHVHWEEKSWRNYKRVFCKIQIVQWTQVVESSRREKRKVWQQQLQIQTQTTTPGRKFRPLLSCTSWLLNWGVTNSWRQMWTCLIKHRGRWESWRSGKTRQEDTKTASPLSRLLGGPAVWGSTVKLIRHTAGWRPSWDVQMSSRAAWREAQM